MTVFLWLLVALVCVGLELISPGLLFFFSFASGALGAALAAVVGYGEDVQYCTGFVVTLIQFALMRQYLEREKRTRHHDDTAIYRIIGVDAIVTRALSASHDLAGQVKVGGELWQARTESKHDIPLGSVVTVTRVEGNTLFVVLKH